MNVQVTYFIDVTSSWCYWAEPAWKAVKERFAGRASFQWEVSLIPKEALPASREQCDWFYRRSGTIVRSPFMLNSGWLEPQLGVYHVPNQVAEAARALGVGDDRVRLALAHAAMREGRKIGRWDVAIEVAVGVTALEGGTLRKHAESAEIVEIIRASTARFHEFKMTQRPSFLIENNIGDRAMLSGTWTEEPLAAAIEAMLGDSAAYGVHAVHFGGTPPP